jgi:KaiC/GvpD/RAD55 family RecA-like ATPase
VDASKVKGRAIPLPTQARPKYKAIPTQIFPHVPTGVADFDAITGGLPPGTVILFMGESGAGHLEFSLTSASQIVKAIEGTAGEFYMGLYAGAVLLPTHVTFVSFTKSREEMVQEVRNTFPKYFPTFLSQHMTFSDLSAAYFSDSLVPPEWSRSKPKLLDGDSGQPGDVLRALARELEEHGKNSLVVVDALSDLLVRSSVQKEDVVTLVKGLRRRAKDWRGLVYLLLTRRVTDPEIEEALKDSVDAVLGFSWVQSPQKSSRMRAMWIEKSMPLLAYMRPEHQGRFVINVKDSGLVTTQYERID